jgi:hypothetical protein
MRGGPVRMAAEFLKVGGEHPRARSEEGLEPVAKRTLAHAALPHDDEDTAAARLEIVLDDADEIPPSLEEKLFMGIVRRQGCSSNEGARDLGMALLVCLEFALFLPDDIEPDAGSRKEAVDKLTLGGS